MSFRWCLRSGTIPLTPPLTVVTFFTPTFPQVLLVSTVVDHAPDRIASAKLFCVIVRLLLSRLLMERGAGISKCHRHHANVSASVPGVDLMNILPKISQADKSSVSEISE